MPASILCVRVCACVHHRTTAVVARTACMLTARCLRCAQRNITLRREIWPTNGQLLEQDVTIMAWPQQEHPITLDMGNDTNFFTFRESSRFSLTFKDLNLANLSSLHAPASPDALRAQKSLWQSLQGSLHAVRFDRSRTRIKLRRVRVEVSAEELSVRQMCANGTAVEADAVMESFCLDQQLVPERQVRHGGAGVH
jgi:hypothetical protein